MPESRKGRQARGSGGVGNTWLASRRLSTPHKWPRGISKERMLKRRASSRLICVRLRRQCSNISRAPSRFATSETRTMPAPCSAWRKPFRQRLKEDGTFAVRADNEREIWWRHARARPKMRKALTGLDRYIATPMVSSYRTFDYLPVSVLPDQKLVVFSRSDEAFLGILQSRVSISRSDCSNRCECGENSSLLAISRG
jgi:hypothetical protein